MMYVMASEKNSFVMIISEVIKKIFFKNTFVDIFFPFFKMFFLSPLQVVYALGH